MNPSPHSIRSKPMSAQRSRYASSRPWATATSKGPPPVVVATPSRFAAATFRRLAASSATIQHAIETLRIEIRCALCSRWLSSVTGSYPGSKGLVAGARSGTPIERR